MLAIISDGTRSEHFYALSVHCFTFYTRCHPFMPTALLLLFQGTGSGFGACSVRPLPTATITTPTTTSPHSRPPPRLASLTHGPHHPELASYVHRQGTERLILLPVHVSTRVISIAFFLCFFAFFPVLFTVVAPEMQSEMTGLSMVPMAIVMVNILT